MIEKFNDVEMRNSGLVYSSTLEQIKKLYQVNPEQAGELAISAIELVLTGQFSSDDMIIELMLEPARVVSQRDHNNYDQKVESARQKKIADQKLDQIAELMQKGYKQREIAEKLHLTQQTVSYRWGVIKASYPELLQKEEPVLQTNLPNVYQNTDSTKVTKDTNFVQKNVCKNDGVEVPATEETWSF